jgi:redox-sensitive bicupin YhaK (pirin superfamily)
MIDLSLEPNAMFEQDLPPAYSGFVYVLEGSVQVGGDLIAAGQVPRSSTSTDTSAQVSSPA